MTKQIKPKVPLSEKYLEPFELLDSKTVFFFYGLTRQALYEARKAGRLVPDQRGKGGRFLYKVGTMRTYRDSIRPRHRSSSPMFRGKP